MRKISCPDALEYAIYYEKYLELLPKEANVLQQLKQNAKAVKDFLIGIPEDLLMLPYAPGKWTLKDVLQHMVDTERVFVYRAMRFARNDKTPMPFFDENDFAKMANAEKVPIKKLLKDYLANRNATLAFFNNLNAAQLKRTGIASNSTMSVRACVWIICAHELHHLSVMQERYKKNHL